MTHSVVTETSPRPVAGAGLTEEEFCAVVAYAGLAPSVHNTQPWRFVASGVTIQVHADPGRRLGYLDPQGRQLAISCGAAVEHARLAIRSLNRSCVVRFQPAGLDGSGPVATLTVGPAQSVSREEQRLIDAVPRRRTDRGPYDARPVPSTTLRRVGELVADRGCWLRILDRPGERAIAAQLLEEAEQIEAGDPEYRAEIAAWTRPGTAVDGVPSQAAPAWDAEMLVNDMPLRDFTGNGRHPHVSGQEPPPSVERDAVVLIGSDDDSPLAWLRTGAALALAWLAFTDADVSLQPLGPVTDVPATRLRLCRALGLLGRPQLLFRIGYGAAWPTSGRRPVAETLDLSPRA